METFPFGKSSGAPKHTAAFTGERSGQIHPAPLAPESLPWSHAAIPMRGVMRIPCSAPAYAFPRQRVPDGRKSRAAFHVHTGFWKTGVRTGGFLAAFAPYRNCVGGAKRAYLAAAHQNADMKTPMSAECRYRPHSRIFPGLFSAPRRFGSGQRGAARPSVESAPSI